MSTSAESITEELDSAGAEEETSTEISFLDLPDDQVEDAMFALMAGEDANGDGDLSAGTLEDDSTDEESDGGEGTGDDSLNIDDDSFVDGDTDDTTDVGGTDEEDEADESEGDEEDESEGDDAEDAEQLITNALEDLSKILSPFKANGKDIQVESVDDALSLMQMGANYNKKMAALKPSLKFVKMLQQNDLLDESKLSTLIDISKKNPQALARFIKDSEIDPESLVGDDAGKEYSPGDYAVNDSEIELDSVLDSIRGNESFTRTVDVVSNQWDPKSKAIIFNDPKIITVIDSHIQSGVFDKIVKRMETEKMLGKLDGVSDIVAYKQIGDQLDAAGLLNESPTKSTSVRKTTVTKQAAKPVDAKRNAARKAAGSTKSTASKPKTDFSDLNPLSMPDEEFEKVAGKTLYI